MTMENVTYSVEQLTSNTTETRSGPGETLKAARLALGLTIEKVANQLNLTTQMISDLEENDYRRISAIVFIRGYLKAYANFLKLDPQTILGQFDVMGVTEVQNRTHSEVTQKSYLEQSHREQYYVWALGSAIVFLLIISFFWWRAEHNSKNELSSSTSLVENNKILSPANSHSKEVTLSLKGEPNPMTPVATPTPAKVITEAAPVNTVTSTATLASSAEPNATGSKEQTTEANKKTIESLHQLVQSSSSDDEDTDDEVASNAKTDSKHAESTAKTQQASSVSSTASVNSSSNASSQAEVNSSSIKSDQKEHAIKKKAKHSDSLALPFES